MGTVCVCVCERLPMDPLHLLSSNKHIAVISLIVILAQDAHMLLVNGSGKTNAPSFMSQPQLLTDSW